MLRPELEKQGNMVKTPIWPPFIGAQDIDLKLVRTNKLLDALGNPEAKLKNIIHVAGTNGKGSTTAFLKAFLQASGYSVNSYTSPHLVNFNERINLNGQDIDDVALEKLSQKCKKIVEDNDLQVTFFEGTTVMAIQAFVDNPADFNIFEVGLGGRLDATNVFKEKLACLITPVSYDHQEFLGDKIEQIAAEKGAIMLPNTPVFIGKQQEEAKIILEEIAKKNNCSIYYYDDYKADIPKELGLNGAHQQQNFKLAAQAFTELTKKTIPENYKKYLSWPARLQNITKQINSKFNIENSTFLDGGHNEHAAHALVDFVKENNIEHIVVAMVKRKNLEKYLQILSKSGAQIYLTEIISSDESIKIAEIPSNISNLAQKTFNNYKNALKYIVELQNSGNILFSGSLFLAGEILEEIEQNAVEC